MNVVPSTGYEWLEYPLYFALVSGALYGGYAYWQTKKQTAAAAENIAVDTQIYNQEVGAGIGSLPFTVYLVPGLTPTSTTVTTAPTTAAAI